ncbi:MAG: glycosyltransferase family 2 protein [Candidatus Dojkabacteria bacterium]
MRSSKPLVSVIMAVRNGEKSLRKTLNSLLRQTYTNIEIVIVNDASVDKTKVILDEFAKKDNRVKVITNKKRLERCVSRNIAIEASKGKYIAVNDADDISFPHRIETEVKYLESNPEVYLVGGRANILDESGRKIGISWGKRVPVDVTMKLIENNVLVHSSIMFRNSKEFFYREKFLHAEDYDLYLQIVANGYLVHLLSNVLVEYRSKKDLLYDEYLIDQLVFSYTVRKLCKQKLRYGKDSHEDVDREYMYDRFPKKDLDFLYFLQSFTHKDFKDARKRMIKIIKEYGFSIKNGFYFIDTFLGGGLLSTGKYIKRAILSLSLF